MLFLCIKSVEKVLQNIWREERQYGQSTVGENALCSCVSNFTRWNMYSLSHLIITIMI